jgi:hypothetical protein
VSALQLFAVAALDPGDQGALAPETDLLVYKDMGAVVRDAPWVRPAPAPRDVDAYRTVIETVFARRTVLPAPVGTLFRSRLALERWLALHYVSLSEGLGFVDGRAMARIHVAASASPNGEGETEAESGERQAAALFRELRRQAAAAIPLPRREGATDVLVGSFLVERERWASFEEVAAQLGRQAPDLGVRLSGPWPPYDFVRLQFGG